MSKCECGFCVTHRKMGFADARKGKTRKECPRFSDMGVREWDDGFTEYYQESYGLKGDFSAQDLNDMEQDGYQDMMNHDNPPIIKNKTYQDAYDRGRAKAAEVKKLHQDQMIRELQHDTENYLLYGIGCKVTLPAGEIKRLDPQETYLRITSYDEIKKENAELHQHRETLEKENAELKQQLKDKTAALQIALEENARVAEELKNVKNAFDVEYSNLARVTRERNEARTKLQESIRARDESTLYKENLALREQLTNSKGEVRIFETANDCANRKIGALETLLFQTQADLHKAQTDLEMARRDYTACQVLELKEIADRHQKQLGAETELRIRLEKDLKIAKEELAARNETLDKIHDMVEDA